MAVAVRVKERRARFAGSQQTTKMWLNDAGSLLACLGPSDSVLVRVPLNRKDNSVGKNYGYANVTDAISLAKLLRHGATVKVVDSDSISAKGYGDSSTGKGWAVSDSVRSAGIHRFATLLADQGLGAHVTALAPDVLLRQSDFASGGASPSLRFTRLFELADIDGDGALSLDEFLVFAKLVQRCGVSLDADLQPIPEQVPERLLSSLACGQLPGSFTSAPRPPEIQLPNPRVPPQKPGGKEEASSHDDMGIESKAEDGRGSAASPPLSSLSASSSSSSDASASPTAASAPSTPGTRTDKTMDADEEASFEALRRERGRGFAFCADDAPASPAEGVDRAAALPRLARRIEDLPPETACGSRPRATSVKSKRSSKVQDVMLGADPTAAGLACVDQAPPRCSSSRRFGVGWAETIGVRMSMEDSFFVAGGFGGSDSASTPADLFGVFDGHGGPDVARFVAAAFPIVMEQELAKQSEGAASPDVEFSNQSLVMRTLESAFRATNELVRSHDIAGGATGCVSLIAGNTLYVANVGDTRCIAARVSEGTLLKPGKKLADVKLLSGVRLTVDHKPSSQTENERIVALGGSVISVTDRDGGVISRIAGPAGRLAVSRAFGDFAFHPFVTADPHVDSYSLDGCPLVIQACDGLFDVVTDDDAVREAYRAAYKARKEPDWGAQAAALRLRNLAWERGSEDNVTCVVFVLRKL